MKLALIQMKISNKKDKNLETAKNLIKKAATNDSDIVVLPEMFNCPYHNKYFESFSESLNLESPTLKVLSKLAKKYSIYIFGGSIPEKYKGDLYNTAIVFDPKGDLINYHRKMHLFDVDIENGITYKESDVLSSGSKITIVNTDFGKIGLAICYDMRFPELIRKMTLNGAKLIVVPAAFNMTTGPAHWHTIAKARSLDNQLYFAMCSPARDLDSSYIAYGHSLVSNPWGKIINELDDKEGILYSKIDFNYIDKIRKELPLLEHLKEKY